MQVSGAYTALDKYLKDNHAESQTVERSTIQHPADLVRRCCPVLPTLQQPTAEQHACLGATSTVAIRSLTQQVLAKLAQSHSWADSQG